MTICAALHPSVPRLLGGCGVLLALCVVSCDSDDGGSQRLAAGGSAASGGTGGSGGSGAGNGGGSTTGGAASNGGTSAQAGGTAGTNSGGGGGGSGSDAGGSGGSTGSGGGGALLLGTDPTNRYVVDGTGAPFLVWGEGAWTLNSQLEVDEQNDYLDTRAAQGLNSFGLQLISRYQDNTPNDADGVAPFTTPGDFATFNAPYFEKAKDLIVRAGERGFVVFVAPSWGGYDEQQGFYDMMLQNGVDKVRDYGARVAELFGDLDNVVWIVGGDKRPPIETAVFDALAAGIRSRDSRHLVTSHWNFAPGDEPSGDWEDLVSAYDWNGGVQYPQIAAEYAEADAPVVLLEALYELNSEFGATARILRLQSIQALLFGAKGAFFGHEGIWHLGASLHLPSQSQGHPYDLDSEGMEHQTHILSLFADRAWHLLEPDTSGELVTAGRGEFGSLDYVGAAKTPDGRLAVVCLPNGGTITVDLTRLSSPVAARWFDATSGVYSDPQNFETAASQEFTAPSVNAAGDPDWVLVLEAP